MSKNRINIIFGKVICEYCKTEIEKETKYINCSKKKNKPMFCNNKCSVRYFTNKGSYKKCGNLNNLDAKNRVDQYSPYRYYFRKATGRRLCNLTLEDIKKQWEKQNGVCALSGLPIYLHKDRTVNDIFSVASLDRIDSSKTYEPGNIQFVVLSLNLAKQSASNDNFKSFLHRLKTA